MRRPRPLVGLIALAVIVRLPFWVEALRLPVDGDTAIVGLMARDGKLSPTFWGQPYGSPLDAWVAAPFVAVFGDTPLAVRLPVFLLGLALVPLAWALARRLHPAAAGPAALLLACPPAYLLLLSALPPPVYPTTLALLGLLLLGALRLADDGRVCLTAFSAWGLLAGLAVWTHLVSLAIVVPTALWLAWRARRARLGVALAVLGLLAGSAPWWTRLAGDPSATTVVSLTGDGDATWNHLRGLLPRLHEPLLGLLGAHTPTTADDPLNHVGLPVAGQVALALLYVLGLLRAVRIARRAWLTGGDVGRRTVCAVGLLGVCALLTIVAFPWPLRSGPETIRFLTPAALPLAVLVAWAPAAEGQRRGAWVMALTLALLHLLPAAQLLGAWRASSPERPLLPDCRDVLRLLDERGTRRAWASYDTAWCLTYLSGRRVIASQPWNERFPGLPPRFRDEVRLAGDAVWVLRPEADFDLPAPERFEAFVRASGGSFRRTEVAGGGVVYDRFVAPFDPAGAPWPGAGAAGDGDVTTRAIEPGRGASTWRLAQPAALGAVTWAAGPEPPGLPRGFVIEVSADGLTFETVARLRAGRWAELAWVDGRPQPREGAERFTLPLGGRTIAALRLTPRPEQGPWGLAELLLHPPRGPLTAP